MADTKLDAPITVVKPEKAKLEELGVFGWSIWTKEVSKFDWHYDEEETCYLLEGDVTVSYDSSIDGSKQAVHFEAGDLVTFEKGLSCFWDIKVPVRKHYKFGAL